MFVSKKKFAQYQDDLYEAGVEEWSALYKQVEEPTRNEFSPYTHKKSKTLSARLELLEAQSDRIDKLHEVAGKALRIAQAATARCEILEKLLKFQNNSESDLSGLYKLLSFGPMSQASTVKFSIDLGKGVTRELLHHKEKRACEEVRDAIPGKSVKSGKKEAKKRQR